MARPACERALTIPELIERVLTHLSPQELLVSVQRVNKQWHHVIAHSLSILCLLHLAADDTESHTLDQASKPVRVPSDLMIRNLSSLFVQQCPPTTPTPPFHPPILQPTASWHNMHVSQPPVCKLAIFHGHRHFLSGPDHGFMHQKSDPDWTITYPDGMRMIDLFHHCRGRIPVAAALLNSRGAVLACEEDDMQYLFEQVCQLAAPKPYRWIDEYQVDHWLYDKRKEKLWYWTNEVSSEVDHEMASTLRRKVDACLVFYSGDIDGFVNGLREPVHVKRPWPMEERERLWRNPMAFMAGGFGGT